MVAVKINMSALLCMKPAFSVKVKATSVTITVHPIQVVTNPAGTADRDTAKAYVLFARAAANPMQEPKKKTVIAATAQA
jgi:hypothetical protein